MSRKLIALVLVLAVASVATAGSIGLPVGLIKMKLEDASALWKNDRMIPYDSLLSSGYDWANAPGDTDITDHPWIGAELRSIWQVTNIAVDGVFLNTGIPAGTEVTGVAVGLELYKMRKTGPTSAALYYKPSATTLDPTDTDGDQSDLPAGSAGYAVLYYDTKIGDGTEFDYNPDGDGDPNNNWDFSTPGLPNFDTAGMDLDGSVVPLVQLALVPLANYPAPDPGEVFVGDGIINAGEPAVLIAEIDTPVAGPDVAGAMTLVNTFYLNSLSGLTPIHSDNVLGGVVVADGMTQFVFGMDGGDARMESTLRWGVARSPAAFIESGWTWQSEDPIEFYTVPEPTTMALLGCGLVAMLRRRRKK